MHHPTREHLRHAPRAADLTRQAGALLENLEPRQLLSAFVYSDLAELVKAPGPSALADGYNGPIAVVGDVDGDNVADVLAGSSGVYTTIRTMGQRSGAALFSGRTGALIRDHQKGFGGAHFGWSVAAPGDVDGDGIPDYAIGADDYEGAGKTAAIYSGATGELLRLLQPHDEPVQFSQLSIARAGDLDGDGRGDLVMGTGMTVVAYSANTGAEIHRFDLADFPDYVSLGVHIDGGKDVDGDGTPDYAFTSLLGTAQAPTGTRVTVVSGATGAEAFSFDVPFVKGDDFELDVLLAPDVNGDDTPDILLTRGSLIHEAVTDFDHRHQLLLHSGADGSLIRTISDPDAYSIASARFVSDVDDDGVPDIAAGVPLYLPKYGPMGGTFSEGAIYMYSGLTGERLAIVTDTSGVTTIQPSGITSGRTSLGYSLATGDLDGDGVVDLVSGTLWSPAYAGPGVSRIVTLDGNYLFQNPVFDGVGNDTAGNLIAWGRLGQRGFVFFQGRLTFLADLPGFSANDRIIEFTANATGYFAVAAPNGDHAQAFSWRTGTDLKNPEIYRFADVTPTGGPGAGYILDRVVDVDFDQVLLQYHSDDDTPAAFRFFVITERLGVRIPITQHLFDGAGIALNKGYTLGASAADPTVGIFALNFAIEEIPGFTPVDVRETSLDPAVPKPQLVGLAQRDGDLAPRPYLYDPSTQTFTALPLIDGATDWMPVAFSYDGGVYGTFRSADGDQSAFRYIPSVGGRPEQMIDVSAAEIVGGPASWSDIDISVLDASFNNLGEFYVRYTDPSTGLVTAAQLSDATWAGPTLVPASPDLAISPDGMTIVTTNAIGGLVVFQRAPETGGRWARYSLGDAFFRQGETYTTPHFGDIITWTVTGGQDSRPYIALATEAGLILLEPTWEYIGPPSKSGESPSPQFYYAVRNLSFETAGTPIVDSLVTLVPSNQLRLLAGLNPAGDVVIYGLTKPIAGVTLASGRSQWAYGNLTDQVLRVQGFGTPVFNPDQDGDLIAYRTAWDGLNIAGVFDGHVVTFWTAPGINGWAYADITQSVPGQYGFQAFKNLSVYLTPWGGINITGNDTLQVYWWTPGLTDWSYNILSIHTGGPQLRSDTITTYVTPWGGLNIAGLDEQNRLWIYWWAPGALNWTAETVDDALSESDRQIPRTGRLAATVSAQGEFNIFSRTPFGHMLRYSWSPTHPWMVEDISVSPLSPV